jgi:hypothetical protein
MDIQQAVCDVPKMCLKFHRCLGVQEVQLLSEAHVREVLHLRLLTNDVGMQVCTPCAFEAQALDLQLLITHISMMKQAAVGTAKWRIPVFPTVIVVVLGSLPTSANWGCVLGRAVEMACELTGEDAELYKMLKAKYAQIDAGDMPLVSLFGGN